MVPGPSGSCLSPGESAGGINGHCPLHPLPHLLGVQGSSGSSGRNPQASLFGKKAKAHKAVGQPADRPREPLWAYFCDFRDITHVVLKEHCVSIHRQDNKCLVRPRVGAGLGSIMAWEDTHLMRPWLAGAELAFPGCGAVLRVAGGRLFPPDGRLQPLPVPRGGSPTAGDEHPGWDPRTPAVSAGWGALGATAKGAN